MKYLDTKKGSLEEAVQQSMSGVVAKDLIEAGGKYLKYSDLLLQKGRLMAKNKSTAMIDKEISKEMKKLGIKESKDEYERFFNSALKKFKIDSPADLKTDAKKKEFFNYVDKNYKGKEEETNLEEGKIESLDPNLDGDDSQISMVDAEIIVDAIMNDTTMLDNYLAHYFTKFLKTVKENQLGPQHGFQDTSFCLK